MYRTHHAATSICSTKLPARVDRCNEYGGGCRSCQEGFEPIQIVPCAVRRAPWVGTRSTRCGSARAEREQRLPRGLRYGRTRDGCGFGESVAGWAAVIACPRGGIRLNGPGFGVDVGHERVVSRAARGAGGRR